VDVFAAGDRRHHGRGVATPRADDEHVLALLGSERLEEPGGSAGRQYGRPPTLQRLVEVGAVVCVDELVAGHRSQRRLDAVAFDQPLRLVDQAVDHLLA